MNIGVSQLWKTVPIIKTFLQENMFSNLERLGQQKNGAMLLNIHLRFIRHGGKPGGQKYSI